MFPVCSSIVLLMNRKHNVTTTHAQVKADTELLTFRYFFSRSIVLMWTTSLLYLLNYILYATFIISGLTFHNLVSAESAALLERSKWIHTLIFFFLWKQEKHRVLVDTDKGSNEKCAWSERLLPAASMLESGGEECTKTRPRTQRSHVTHVWGRGGRSLSSKWEMFYWCFPGL